jgi:hypothetical protein
VTELQAGTARNLSSISNRGKRLFCCQKHANRNWNPQTVPFSWSEIKRPGREADNHQQTSHKMKDEPAVTAVTLRIAAVVRDSCAFIFC